MICSATINEATEAPVVLSRASQATASRINGRHLQEKKQAHSTVDAREQRLFQSLDVSQSGKVQLADFLAALAAVGLQADDPRLGEMAQQLASRSPSDVLSCEEFCHFVRSNILLIERALQGNMVVPDFERFCQILQGICEATEENQEGQVADYIPQLARVNPDQFAVSVCTIDGQRYSYGDAGADFSVQSCCKPLNYCLALEELGEEEVHRYVGREPSGRIFNELTLNDQGKPHNPMINAGAIMTASLINPELDNADRFDYVLDRWRAMCGGRKGRFNNAVYQSERASADRNFALGYFMKEKHAFPENSDLLKTLDFYFQCCSIEVDADQMSVFAATLANGGVCPTNGDRVLSTESVKRCLSLMCSCGMYDFSGEFAFVVGLPAKSGVGGGIMVAIPNVMGICIWSPRIDLQGNSVRGIELLKRLVEVFNLHNFDNLSIESDKIDPRVNQIQSKAEKAGEMIWAASKGDVGALQRLVVRGYDQNASDYDRRTPLHLAAAEGQRHLVSYLIESGAELSPRDRWGGTPLDDAARFGHQDVADLIVRHGGGHGGNIPLQMKAEPWNPTAAVEKSPSAEVVELIYAASEGNLTAIQRLVARGIPLDLADYDLRTPLHLAAAEGHLRLVQYIISHQMPIAPRDRWGNTPQDEADRHGHKEVAELLKQHTLN